jgi:transposase
VSDVLPPRRPPSPRQAGWRWLQPLVKRPAEQPALRTKLLATAPAGQEARSSSDALRERRRTRTGEALPAWRSRAEPGRRPARTALVTNLHRDDAAVPAALTADGGAGPIEGQLPKTTLIKRQG